MPAKVGDCGKYNLFLPWCRHCGCHCAVLPAPHYWPPAGLWPGCNHQPRTTNTSLQSSAPASRANTTGRDYSGLMTWLRSNTARLPLPSCYNRHIIIQITPRLRPAQLLLSNSEFCNNLINSTEQCITSQLRYGLIGTWIIK